MDIKKINQYEAFHKIGESGLSVIYKAYDTEKQIQVSVKQLKPSVAVTRDLHKLKAYIGLEHPNLCTVHSVEEHEESIVVVSDYIDGTSLQKLLVNSEFHEENLLDLLLQISNALSVLHKKNLPHGNLKPSNILITKNSQAILTDAGLSPFENFQNSPEFIAPYEAYHYLSPEQIKNEAVGCQTDFFAIGVIAYRILFGRLPFDGKNEDELIKSILFYQPQFSELNSDSFHRINALLLGKLLAKDQKDRFVNTFELKATLQEIKLIEQNNKEFLYYEQTPSNPRKYLTLSVLAVLVAILWLVASIPH